MWEIREGYGDRMGYRGGCPMKYDDPDLQEAYECGWEDHEEMMSEPMGERYGSHGGSMVKYPMGERMVGGRYMGERRSRDSMGRYR